MAYIPGPFDTEHYYVQWGGKLPGGEQWSCGVRLTPVGVGGDLAESDPAYLNSVKTAVTSFHNGGAAGISQYAKLSFVKMNAIAVSGKYLYQTTQEAVIADTPGGGAGAGNVPNQVALAVSLTTGFSRGPAHRGRFFLPMPVMLPAADGLITAAQADAVSGAVDTLINALNNASPNFEVSVMSRKLGTPGHRRVTGNQVGRVLDTQRRRRRSLPEAYV